MWWVGNVVGGGHWAWHMVVSEMCSWWCGPGCGRHLSCRLAMHCWRVGGSSTEGSGMVSEAASSKHINDQPDL
jgi:hypothetical protein